MAVKFFKIIIIDINNTLKFILLILKFQVFFWDKYISQLEKIIKF